MVTVETIGFKNKTTLVELIKYNNGFSPKQHQFFINNNLKNKIYEHKNNTVNQSKYNLITFLPKGILIQFLRFANIYFLVIAVIQMIPVISPLSSSTALVPFLFVLFVSLVREALEDLRRHKFDDQLNSEMVLKYKENKWTNVQSGKLKIGDIIIIEENNVLPADIIILDSSIRDGKCYIETATLDGEKTLKTKLSPLETTNMFKEGESNYATIFDIQGECISDLPCPELYKFNGFLKFSLQNKTHSKQCEIGIDGKQLILKGSILKNTHWIIGFVIYTGHNTKLIQNSNKGSFKQSRVEKLMSRLIQFILLLQFLLCIIAAILNYIYAVNVMQRSVYLGVFDNLGLYAFLSYFTYMLLLNTMVPISLIISLDIIKFLQGYFLSVDVEMYSQIREKFVKAGSISLNEELGLVDYIFCDKTGTLTCNKMNFKYCLIGDSCYEYLRNSDFSISNDDEIKTLRERLDIKQFNQGHFSKLLSFNTYSHDMKLKTYSLIEFWKALLLAHECNIESNNYTANNPDDVELLKTARDQGFELVRSEKNNFRTVKVEENYHNFEVLSIQEFSSDRRRMSIVVRDNNIIKLYIKGADCEIKKRLSADNSASQLEFTDKFVDLFSQKGFRTLLVGFKVLDEDNYQQFINSVNHANHNLVMKKEKLDEAFNQLEQGITLLGATVVEDKLQDLVPDTIRDLRLAKIKVWMLTGDKFNTAYNIALSCNLISSHMKVFQIQGELGDSVDKFLNEYLSFININNSSASCYSIILDSVALANILSNNLMLPPFLEAAKNAESVVCCRTSPLQKAEIVKAMKEFLPEATTMAIGDGGNDVSMILEAHVGVGVYGEEGMRAVQASDFSIGEFRFLRKLLFFHGRHNYIRISEMIMYFFYKNFVFTINQLYYGFFNNFSGQTIFDDWFITFFNTTITATPLLARALFDQDLTTEDGELIQNLLPLIYAEARDNPIFTINNFFFNILRGTIHGILNFMIVYYSINLSTVDIKGNTADLWYFSTNLFTNIVYIVSIRLLIVQSYYTWINIFIMVITSWLQYALYLYWAESDNIFNSIGTMSITFNSPNFYLNFLLSIGFMFIIDHLTYITHFYANNSLTTALRIYVNDNKNEKSYSEEIINSLNYYNIFIHKKSLYDSYKFETKNEKLIAENIEKISIKTVSPKLQVLEFKKPENPNIEDNDLIYLKDYR